MFQDDDLLQEFVVESLSHLADIESQLLEIEAAGSNINVDLVNTVFRAIHSIKGAAGFLGLSVVNSLAHSLENVLNQVRNLELIPTDAIVNTMLASSDRLRSLIENVSESNNEDVSQLVVELDAIAEGRATETAPPAFNQHDEQFDEEIDDTLSEPNESPIQSYAQESAPLPNASAHAPPAAKSPAPNKQSAESSQGKSAKPADSIVRVNVAVLDRLMNLAGELVLSRNQLLLAVNNGVREGLDNIASRVDQVTSELQETIMQTRMQPIGTVFSRFPRVVRDLSAKLLKEIKLEIEGNEVEVDKTIVEAMGDPLTHLVRNSVDHGVELPAVRVAAGKPQVGTIRLRAFHQAGKVCIRIEDDGAGINPEKLRAKAVEKGIITQDQANSMSDSEALRLIFAPGFSTAAQVTDVSGRGVGMDVVRTNIEQLGGTVDVESIVGQGAAIHITLPLTLAIIPSMIVGCAGERYAVPQSSIAELVRVSENELDAKISHVHGAEVLRLRGALLPLIRLDEALGLKDESSQSSRQSGVNVLVLETGQTRYGLVVDSLHDNEEIVVKPLGKHVKDLGYLAGATILGDGYVALILDIVGLASQSNLRNIDTNAKSDLDETANTGATERHRLLLFANNPEEQFAIPMAMVARIERIKAKEIVTVGQQDLLVYRGTSLPILRVENCIRAERPDASIEHVFVIVFRIEDREIGLVAPILRDIRDVEMTIDTRTLREIGVPGALIIDEQTTRLLDLVELTRARFPDWFKSEQPAKTDSSTDPEKPTTILLAEDSDFFRSHVSRTLENEGYVVIGAVDGKDAWDHLQEVFDDIDLIITDIEMPRMNGLELAKAIRSNEKTSQLPIIALTSLATDDDRSRGSQAGIDEYQVKMDPARLMKSVRKLVAESRG